MSNKEKRMDPKFLSAGDDPWTVLAVYGDVITGAVARQLFTIARAIIESTGLEANVLGVQRGTTYGRYKRMTPRLVQSMQVSDFAAFATAYVPPPETDGVRFGWIEANTFKTDFVLSGRTSLLSPQIAAIVPMVLDVASVYPIKYGYQYVIDHYYGPSLHANGLFCTRVFNKKLPELPPTESNRTMRWRNRYKEAIPKGALRDVFPLNLLTDAHHNRRIGNVSLFDWIEQDSSRGCLKKISPTLWTWQVPDENCVELGNTLETAGLLA